MNLVYLKPCANLPYRYISRLHLSSNTQLLQHSHISHWNSFLKSYLESKNSQWGFVLFRQMLQSNVKPNDLTFSLLIKACSFLSHSFDVDQEVNQIHTHIVKCGFNRFVYVGTALLDLYAKTGWVFRAEQMFEDMPHRDLIAWNSLISGYSYNVYDLSAFRVLVEMLKEGLSPCPVTMISVIPSCARMGFIFQGKSIHGFGIKIALDVDSRVKNALTSMYAKFSWNTMISAYGQNGYFDEALLVFKRMCEENVGVNAVTIVSLLSADAPLDFCMYARSGNTKLAQLLYESKSCQKNLVSLTAIISSYAEQGDMPSALECLAQIEHENMKPDAVTIVSILHGCTSFIHMDVGTAFHGYTIKSGLASDKLVVNGLISMYDKLNDIDAAYSLFLSLDERPVISWNTMISIYSKAGKLNDAMRLFCQMKMFGYSPDRITITSMLAGCSELNSLQIGRSFHCFILRNNLEIEDFLGTALLDMYAKCGSIKNAERVFKAIKNPCLATWNTMISGYGICGLEHESLIHYSEMIKFGVKPDDITFLGLLSVCNHSGLVDEGRKYFKIMTEDFGVVPGAQHCACMIDLFSRAGLLDEAVKFIEKMNVEPDSVMWLTLLGACYIHKEVRLGECLAKKIFLLDQRNGGLYVLMSNLYASTGRWNDVARVREMMREVGEDGFSGTSFIEATCPS
ncbi:hypothetical protein AQUCO_01500067v1 [Aquilegia coerulea]|uniref:Pentacotripeptide-repeat region of PRORP domain-containing protein n=1 Tax=Aquilegia coerulea TaxID=218851 RepID=A0A2G5DS27_AQUCA|nr:hypothetical protein AQUCO_01500067v1 [Aquilegia coerulea]